MVYLNNSYILYARNDIIKKTPFDLTVIDPKLNTELKFKPQDEKKALSELKNLLLYDPNNDFARLQLILYYKVKNIDLAKQLAYDSYKINPSNPWFTYMLTSINAKQNNCKEAKKYGSKTIYNSFNDFYVNNLVKTVTSKCPTK